MSAVINTGKKEKQTQREKVDSATKSREKKRPRNHVNCAIRQSADVEPAFNNGLPDHVSRPFA